MSMTVSKMKDVENDMNDTGTILRSKVGKDVHNEPIHEKKTELECQNGH